MSSLDKQDVRIIEIDYNNQEQMNDLLFLLDAYSADKMGQDRNLTKSERDRIVNGLKNQPTFFSLIAYKNEKAAGLANCMIGFSTFAGKQLINIHDLCVNPEYRGNGIGKLLLDAVTEKAKEMDCCKVTLEVRDDNPARRLYRREGFGDDKPPLAFWHKKISV